MKLQLVTRERDKNAVRHAILGAGGVGGFLAVPLANAGEEVILLVRSENLGTHPETVRVERAKGMIEAKVRIRTSLTDDVDVLWIAVKAHQLQGALREVSLRGKIGSIIPLLNGVEHVPLLRSTFGYPKVVPATIVVSAERRSPGHIVQHSPFARLSISVLGGRKLLGISSRLQSAGFVVEFAQDENTMLWKKLAFLAPLALTGAASGKDKHGVFTDSLWKERLHTAVEEVCAVARAEGAVVDRGDVLAVIGGLPPGMRSSLQKDVWSGVPSELDAIGGAIVRAGERHRIKVPEIERLVSEVEGIVEASK
jgi:2-dehydropantoate 2-reductase